MVSFIDCANAFGFLAATTMNIHHNLCAYLDPGTGSIIIQIIVAGLFGVLFVIKLFWSKIKNLLKKLFSKNSKAEEK